MSRLKKSRKAKGFIDDRGPSRKERLSDPESYDSRKRKALEQKKKRHKSVYERQRQEAAENDQSTDADQRKTRLAEKIRRLNQEKTQD